MHLVVLGISSNSSDSTADDVSVTGTNKKDTGHTHSEEVVVLADSDARAAAAFAVARKAKFPVLVDFFAEWCDPCKVIRPMLGKLARRHASHILFLAVDVEKCGHVAGFSRAARVQAGVGGPSAVPTATPSPQASESHSFGIETMPTFIGLDPQVRDRRCRVCACISKGSLIGTLVMIGTRDWSSSRH